MNNLFLYIFIISIIVVLYLVIDIVRILIFEHENYKKKKFDIKDDFSSEIREEYKSNVQEFKGVEKTVSSNLIGIGGGGCNIAEYLTLNYPNNYNTVIINSDKNALLSKKVARKIHLKKDNDYGCGSNELCGFSLINENILEQLRTYIGTNNKVFIVVTLGGGVGSGSTKAIAKYLHKMGIEIHLILVKPFQWEGRKKLLRANDTLAFIKTFCNNIDIFYNDDLTRYSNSSMKECFTMLNDKIDRTIKKGKYE